MNNSLIFGQLKMDHICQYFEDRMRYHTQWNH